MTQGNSTPAKKRPSPLRGIVLALIIVLVFFPNVRSAVGHLVGIVLAATVGAVLTMVVLSGSRRRR